MIISNLDYLEETVENNLNGGDLLNLGIASVTAATSDFVSALVTEVQAINDSISSTGAVVTSSAAGSSTASASGTSVGSTVQVGATAVVTPT